MHRRKPEEMKGPTEPVVDDEEAFLAAKEKVSNGGCSSSASLGAGLSGASGTSGGGIDAKDLMRRPLHGAWSAPALLVMLLFLSLVVWTLPAPTFAEKMALLRQSWRLNAVLDESAQLKGKIADLVLEKANLEGALTTEQARAVELQQRLGNADSEAKSLSGDLAAEQKKKVEMSGSNQQLQAQIDRERVHRRELLHRLQAVKRAELRDLAQLDEGPKPVAVQSVAEKQFSSAAAEQEADRKMASILKQAEKMQEQSLQQQNMPDVASRLSSASRVSKQ